MLDAYRGQGATVIHIQHVWDEPDATYMRPGTAGVEIHPDVAPSGDETVLAKSEPNSFTGTGLEAEFHSRGIDQVTVVGMMTSMCVDSTVRAGAELGFQMSVVHDACAASDLEFGDTSVPGSQVQAAFMAALSDGIAAVVSGDDAVNEITGANH